MSNRRLSGRILVALAATAALVLPLDASQAMSDQTTVPGKTFAAYEYWWYPIDFVDHFIDPLSSQWEVEGSGDARTQNGMLTLMSTRKGSLGVTLRGHDRDRGRWEIRLRGKRFETGNTDYTVAAELIPAGAGTSTAVPGTSASPASAPRSTAPHASTSGPCPTSSSPASGDR